ncbi:MAG: AAA family ATPase [Anaerolineae bacterium]
MSAFNPTQRQIWRRNLRDGLNIDNLKSICFDLDIEYEDIAGETKSDKINGLLETLFRTNRLEQFRSYLIDHEEYGHVTLPGLGELIGETPYVGLSAFSEENAQNFYGREEFVAQLQNAIEKQPFVPVLGPSGSGKSSLIFAGLFPKVRQMPDWMVLNTRPGADVSPLHSLVTAFLNPAMQDRLPHERRKAINDATQQILAGVLTPMELVTDLVQQNEKVENVLLYIDQFEELFTADQDDEHAKTNQFLEHLVPLIKSTSKRVRLVILITMRADFLGYALGHPALADLLNHYDDVKLRPLKIERDPENEDELSEMERVIILPAQNAGASFQEGVVERIIEDVAKGTGNLPLLQFALTELWNVQEDGILTHQGYDFIGQADGALVNHAEAVFEELSAAEKKLARQLFVQLVQPGRGTTDTRRIAKRGELSNEVWQLAQKLSGEEARLIYASSDATQRETVQVTHEALIANWQRLKDWMDEDRAFREWQEQFRADVALWLESDHPDDFLYKGARLAQSNEQIRLRQPNLQESEQRFIETSQMAAEADAKAKEEARQLELDQARQLAEAQERELHAQKRRTRSIWMALGIISLLLIGSIYATYQSVQNATIALEASNRAQTQALMSLSTTTLPDHISPSVEQAEQAILMGVQAIRNNDALEGKLLSLSFINRQMRTLMEELEKPTWSPIIVGDTELFPGDFAFYKQLDITADGRYVIASEEFGYLYLWDMAQPEMPPIIFDTYLNESSEYGVAIAPDGAFIASYYEGFDIGIWTLDNNEEPLAILQGHDDFVTMFEVSANGRLLATAGFDGVINIWDMTHLNAIGDPIPIISDLEFIIDISLSADGKTVFVANQLDESINELIGFDTSDGSEQFRIEFADIVRSIEAAPNGRLLAVGTTIGDVYLVPLAEDNEDENDDITHLKGQVSYTTDIEFSADSNLMATVSDDKTVFVWNLIDLGEEPLRLQGHTNHATSAVFLPTGNQLISSGQDNPLLLWHLTTDSLSESWMLDRTTTSPQIIEAEEWVTQVTWSPDGQQLAAGYRDGSAEVFSTADPTVRGIINPPNIDRMADVVYSPDGKWLVGVIENEKIQIWDTLIYEVVAEFDFSGFALDQVAFTPDSKNLLAPIDGNIYVWSAADWEADPVWTSIYVADEGLFIDAITLSADGSKIALAMDDGSYDVLVFGFPEIDPNDPLHTFTGNVHFINALDFSPDGRWLASGNRFSKIHVWDLDNPDADSVVLEDHQAFILALDFSPDSQQLVSAADDNTVRVWDTNDWTAESQLLEGHQAFVWSAEYSPDGKYIVSGSTDQTIRIWPTLDTLVELACERVTRNMTSEEWDRFLPSQPYQQTCPNLPPAGSN